MNHQGNQHNPAQQPGNPPVYSGWNAANAPMKQPQGNFQSPNHHPQQFYGQGNSLPPLKKGGRNLVTKLLVLVVVALVLVLLGAWGLSSIRENQIKQALEPYQNVYPPNMFINDIPLEGLTPLQAKDKLLQATQDRINSWTLALVYQGFTFTNLNYSVLGIQADEAEFEQLLNQAYLHIHQGSIHEQKAAIDALVEQPLKLNTNQKQLQSTELLGIIQQIAPFINANPVNAAILEFRPDDEYPFVFQDERFGAKLDVQKTVEEIMAMGTNGESGTYQLSPEILEPSVTRAQLANTVALRTSISTAISTSSDADRNYNIMLSLQKFNGTVLKPGQLFSFNDVVGPRTEEAGFRPALEYAYGDLVYGIGGGVCQASTTLYQAVLTSGLSIVKRYPHSGPVDYTLLGQDATVFLSRDRNIDFQFRNTTSGDIYITAHVQQVRNNSKRLVANINVYGLSLGDGVSYKLRSDIVQVLPPPTEKKYESDKEGLYVTYTDEEKLKTKASEGQVIETYLEKYQNGVLIEQPQLLTSDTFRAKPAVYWRGVSKRDQ